MKINIHQGTSLRYCIISDTEDKMKILHKRFKRREDREGGWRLGEGDKQCYTQRNRIDS